MLRSSLHWFVVVLLLLASCHKHSSAPPPLILGFNATPDHIGSGESTLLSVSFAQGEASIDQGIGPVASGAGITVTPSRNTAYTLTVRNSDGVVITAAVGVTVSALNPARTPAVEEFVDFLDPGVTIDPQIQPLHIQTTHCDQELSTSGTTVRHPVPTLTCFGILAAQDGSPVVPFAIRPEDAATHSTTITGARLALGFLGMHPGLSQVSDTDRETLLDAIAAHPSFPYVVTRILELLATNPAAIRDANQALDLYSTGSTIVNETAAAFVSFSGRALLGGSCGDPEPTSFLAVQAGSADQARLVNPRHVFYGVRMQDPGGRVHIVLAPPREGLFHLLPPGPTDPTTECLSLEVGTSTIEAQALDWTEWNIATPAGQGTMANSLYAVLQVLKLVYPLAFVGVGPSDLTQVLMAAGTEVFAGDLSSYFQRMGSVNPVDVGEVVEELLDWLGNGGMDQVLYWIYQSSPSVAGAATPYFRSVGSFLGSWFNSTFVQVAGYVLAAEQLLPFLTDLVLLWSEGLLTYTVTRDGSGVHMSSGPEFLIDPRFEVVPQPGIVSQAMTFDPASSVVIGQFSSLYRCEWVFDDWDRNPLPDIVDYLMGPVQHTFSQPGLHNCTLRIQCGTEMAMTFSRPVYVSVPGIQNIGFESGTQSGWVVETHTWTNTTPGSAPSHCSVVGVGMDPIAIGLSRVFYGASALRIEDAGTGAYISSATRTFTVPAGLRDLTFAWAAVLEDPRHVASNQPYFDIEVRNETTNMLLYTIHHYAAEPGFPWQSAVGDWLYVPWQPVTIPLASYVGNTISIRAIAADCSQTGHGGYVYLDALEVN